MTETFRAQRKFEGPRWLTEGEGGLVGYALDVIKDAFARRASLGLRARFPQNTTGLPGEATAPPDALIELGRDRRVFRGIFETDAEYASRLVAWLDDRKTAGNAFTLLRQLHAYTGTANGVSFRTVDNSGNWYSRSSAGVETASLATGNWNWDGDASLWSRFWVVIYPGTLWTVGGQTWGPLAKWGAANRTWGSTAITQEQTRALQAIVADWKPGGTRCVNIILASDSASFNPASPEPDGQWGKQYKYSGGTAVPSRLQTARYLDGA